jgi:hypothetical protein
VSTAAAVLAWIGLALGVPVLLVVLALLNRVLRPIREIHRYAGETLDAGLGIARNLDAADELASTRGLASALPALTRPFVEKAGGR